MSRSNNRGERVHNAFTLIELLVVIAIIAILAAILFPVFAQAKLAAKKTADLSQTKQIGLAAIMYQNDYDDLFHMIRNGAWDNGGSTGCFDGLQANAVAPNCPHANGSQWQLYPYIKNLQLFTAPVDSVARVTCSGPSGGALSFSYSFADPNGVTGDPLIQAFGLCGIGFGTPRSTSRNASSVGNPADTAYILPLYASWGNIYYYEAYRIDNREYGFTPDQWAYGIDTYPKVTMLGSIWCSGDNEGFSIGAYNGKTNVGFADGHSKAIDRKSMMDPLWATDPATAVTNHAYNMLNYDGAYHNR